MAGTTRISGSDSVRVTGLVELRRALEQVEGGLSRELRTASKEIATDVAAEARGVAAGLGGVAAKTAPSVKAAAGITSAGVALGGAAYPFAAGAAFGGRGRPTTQQFQPHLGTTGYFPYPTIRRRMDDIEDAYGDAVDDLIRRAGLA